MTTTIGNAAGIHIVLPKSMQGNVSGINGAKFLTQEGVELHGVTSFGIPEVRINEVLEVALTFAVKSIEYK